MPLTWQEVVYGLFVPLLVAALVREIVDRWIVRAAGAAVGFAAGFEAGYWLLGLGAAAPEAHWQWLPYALLLTLPAAIGNASSRRAQILRWVALVVLAGGAAWLVVPLRMDLQPPRSMAIALVLLATLVGGHAVQRALGRDGSLGSGASLAAVFATAPAILLLSGSLRFAQMAGCGLAAYLGAMVAHWRRPTWSGSIGVPAAYFLAAAMVIGYVNSFSQVPAVSYLLVAMAPITLWPVAEPGRRPAVRLFVAAGTWFVCLVALTLAILAEYGSADGY